MSDPDSHLNAAYSLGTPDDNRRHYDDWAATYDSTFLEASDYILHLQVTRTFHSRGGRGPLLDLGAGTGAMGEALAEVGLGPVDATDISAEMLEIAQRKGVYRQHFTGDILAGLDVPDDTYNGAISSGVFTHGHVGPEALSEVVRILKPGGLAVLSVNLAFFDKAGFGEALAQLSGVEQVETHDVPIYGAQANGDHKDDLGRLICFVKSA